MCGICGIIGLNKGVLTTPPVIKWMADAIKHRGPDDEGYLLVQTTKRRTETRSGDDTDSELKSLIKNIKEKIDFTPNLLLGHRRLAVIDTSFKAHQPMGNKDRNIWIIHNGEIYNFIKLREMLVQRGYKFYSESDTEVLLYLYEEYGEKCLDFLNGDFASCLWDSRNNKLFLARDRLGVKPLYYTVSKDKFVFASEIKAILQVPGVELNLDYEALSEYFTFQNIYTDRTLFKGIKLLPAGHFMVIQDGKISVKKYWDFVFNNSEDKGEEFYKQRLREVLETTVERQLVSDVPLGCYLSGGIDSGSIVSVASKFIPRFMTFTGGFDLTLVTDFEANFDERSDAEILARTFGTEHYERVMHSGDMAWVLPKIVWHLEDLRVGMCWPNYYIARLASRFAKVVLTGGGGDEMFGGYPWRYRIVADVKDEEDFEKKHYQYWNRLIPEKDKTKFFTKEIWSKVNSYSTFDAYRSIVKNAPNRTFIDKALYFDVKTFLHGLLIIADRLTMAHSLEARVPFLDKEIVDLSRTIPSYYKVANYSESGGKYILKEALEDLLPKEIIQKRKQGFSPPDASWYKGPSMSYVKEILLDPNTLNRGYFKKGYIRKMINEHIQGRVNHRLLIWSLLSFEWWNRIFIDGERP